MPPAALSGRRVFCFCSTTFDDVCRGCGRTVVEAAEWVFMSAEDKERVWQRITAEGYPRRNT